MEKQIEEKRMFATRAEKGRKNGGYNLSLCIKIRSHFVETDCLGQKNIFLCIFSV